MCECSDRNENTAMNKVGTASAFTDGYTTHLYNGCLMSHTRNCLNPDLLCTHSFTGHFAAELGSLRHALVQTLVFLLIHSHRVRRQKMDLSKAGAAGLAAQPDGKPIAAFLRMPLSVPCLCTLACGWLSEPHCHFENF